jgi:hypothetical protein
MAGAAQAGGKYGNEPIPVVFDAKLSGLQEVPSVSTPGWGRLRAKFDAKAGEIHFRLSYGDLEGDAVRFAHVHFGQRSTNGGVAVFLCTNEAAPPGVPAPPTCPPPSGGVVEGVLSAADVLGPAAQGIEPGELEELVRAMRRGASYVNVHSDLFPGGEIRGQLREEEPPKSPKKPKKGKPGPPDWAGPPDWVPGPPPWVKGEHGRWDDDDSD